MFKPDNFKLINDTYGHEAGDRALQIMARELDHLLTGGETAIRFLGNELAVLLPGDGQPEALKRAREIQEAMQNLDLCELTGGELFRLTVSIGIAVCPKHARTADKLIDRAHALPLIGRERGGGQILFPEDG
jgi:diguanylate cyclase (GGDEF)-like protein